MICGKTSLPAPLSPMMSTESCIGATCTAVSMALRKSGSLPMMPNRAFISELSAISQKEEEVAPLAAARERDLRPRIAAPQKNGSRHR